MKLKYLYHIYKMVICLFLLSLCTQLLAVNPKTSDIYQQEKDSLKQVLSTQSDPKITMQVLHRLSVLYMQKPEEIFYLKQLLEQALKKDSIAIAYTTLSALSRYYYNNTERDSLMYWVNYIDSMSTSRKEYPNAYFDAWSYSCQDLLWRNDYELAMNSAVELYKTASEKQQTYGLVRCSESLGLIYQTVRQDSDAIIAFQEGLNLLETIDGKLETRIRITSYQAECGVQTDMFAQTEAILKRYKQYIDLQNERKKQTNEQYSVKREYWLLYSLYTKLYTKENRLKEAGQALDSAIVYSGNTIVEGDYVEKIYLYALAYYNKQTGNTQLALHYINELLKTSYKSQNLQLKADILRDEGKILETLALYDQIYNLNSKRNNETFFRQINQLRTLHEINNTEMQSREMQVNAKKITQKQHLLIISMITVLILLILLYVLFIFFRRAKQLKNELQKEKASLLESENNLRKEKEKAEKASRMKSAFVANMSHEIRTPLNAIVGFSELLTDESAIPKDKEEYASVIKNNTAQLLNLINDVLDLSRMETGNLYFNMDNYLLKECCQKALDSIRQRIPEGVLLTFTPAHEEVIVYTDTLRLQQILTNLLSNASKFTQNGEINLSYYLTEEKNKVYIAVTDTGKGIPIEQQDTIFKRFKKLDDYKPGAGLGLSICSVIAERLNGSLSIDSTYTTGARFFFIHPCNISNNT